MAVPIEMMNDGMTHLTTGAGVIYTIEMLKRSSWIAKLTPHTDVLNRLVSAGAALVIGVGITWEGSTDTGWTIHIPMATALLAGLWEWGKQFALQQLLYDTALAPRKVKAV